MNEVVVGDFELTMCELREVARYVVESAEPLLSHYEAAVPDDDRPRRALEAAWRFVNGEGRTKLQRATSLDAHRAAASAPTEAARLAAQSAGDAASAAYLHPIYKAHQVGHILRAAANAARIAEIKADGDHTAGDQALQEGEQRAGHMLRDVLSRYPLATRSRSRAAQLMSDLDEALRSTH